MKKIYTLMMALAITFALNAQTVIDLTKIDAAYTKTIDGSLVIDVATVASKVATPALSYENPFKGKTFSEAEISFDVNNYGEIKVLGSLLAIFDPTLGRMYFTNGGYLGYNATGGWFDANMINYGIGTDFIGLNTWKNIRLKFTATGFALYVDNTLAFDQKSTDVTISKDPAAPFADYTNVISFLQNASLLVFGTGSWWSDNTKDDGTYWDPQNSYLKNIKFSTSTATTVKKMTFDANSLLLDETYYRISGAKAGADFDALEQGIYIKRATYSNGTVKSTKVVKAQ